MSIPDYQLLMLPLLEILEDGEPRSLRECIETLAEKFSLTYEERKQLLPSGQQPVFGNRVGWARTYLKKAGLLDSPRRGFVKITERGKEVLKNKPNKIDNAFLKRFEEFRNFISSRRGGREFEEPGEEESCENPVEKIEGAYAEHQAILAEELLGTVRQVSPAFFERLVVQLLVKMGYGGRRLEAASVVGRSGDEGIDGIINEDALGLDVIYIQAKQWGNSVGRPEIQRFVGALHGQRARKGVFITTSTFTNEALGYVKTIDPKVVLIDGETLVNLMIDHGVGVSIRSVYELKAVNRDFFEEP